ncbi:inorganic phosphate transporter, PiT family [Actinokineospora alba]|uniref:Phosphate transporter n=1 Tax=Actinokineospora alba TaxID=504798 RepID=A0A1H0UUI0_9PSEU|nr:inorganic phosphate transporter [Actinokineospora alba]TDP69075.1 PiT family inorganic phosphate transporter [Actinokineospora alba]SDI78990.1 inorganic phosphate transporter, PiT family [Actinokineospora alba]SDP69436.1 inorganic phosphate transporter, PiT family [Actinokineospora alba]
MDVSVLVTIVVVTALIFDFTNGFHDTANAMATSIATGALRPKVAVALSAVLNLVGAFLSVEVAKTISGGLVDDAAITPAVVFGGLVGAIVWNLLTWYVGLPSSSSHALFGGLIGATWVAAGSDAVRFAKLAEKVLVPALAAPLIAGLAGMVATYLAFRITRRATASRTPRGFRIGQIASASMLSLAHGTNDAQKTMGIITLTMISAGTLPKDSGPPVWVIVSAGVAIALGTYLGGWRIIRTLGRGITDIGAPQGFAAQASATAVILTSSHLGIALSTTHVCSGGILGAGLGTPQAKVQWGTAGRMILAWVITLPAAGLAGALAGVVAESGTFGTIVVAVVGLAFGLGIYIRSRRDVVGAHNVNDIPVEPIPGETVETSGGSR